MTKNRALFMLVDESEAGMIRLFACDLDGTLLNESHECDEVIDSAIDTVLNDGRFFTIATGRTYDNVAFIKKHKGAYAICLNGALCVSDKGEVIKQEAIDKAVLSDLIDRFEHLNIEYMSNEMTYVMTSEEEFTKKVLAFSEMSQIEKEHWLYRYLKSREGHMVYEATKEMILSDDILKIGWHISSIDEVQDFEKYLKEHEDDLTNAPCNNRLYEITRAGVNKGKTIKWLSKRLGVKDEEVAVYGDGGNDLEMLKMFENSYAPSDAKEEAKECAKYILGPYGEYSVAKHLIKTVKEN